MRILGAMLSASLVVSTAADARDKAPTTLPKTSKWEINYDADSCHLLARFGDGKQSAIMRLTRYQPGDWFDLSLYGKPLEMAGPQVKVRIGYTLAAPILAQAMTGTNGDNLPLLIVHSQRLDGWTSRSQNQPAPLISPDQEAQANAIDLAIPGGKHLRLETGSFGKPMAAMRTCVTDLVRKWGYDPVQQGALSRRPTPLKNPGEWLGSGDFPDGALGHNGQVEFRLDVDEAGLVNGCHVLHRTNPDDFADLTCKLLSKRAKFTPALDRSGQPARSFYIGKVHWLTSAS